MTTIPTKENLVKLSRSECSILPLVLKSEWYNLIEKGEKRQEYRDSTQYWAKRISKWNDRPRPHIVEFRKGYSRNAPRMAFLVCRLQTMGGIRSFAQSNYSERPDWGQPDTPHFIIQLNRRVNLV